MLWMLHLLCGQWKIGGSARCAWQAVPWSRVCPELRGDGCTPAPGDVGSPRTLTDMNFCYLWLCAASQYPGSCLYPSSPVPSTPLGTPQQLCSSVGAPHLLPSARGLFPALWADRA